MKIKLVFFTAWALMLALVPACQNAASDPDKAAVQSMYQELFIGMSREQVEKQYGRYPFMSARTAANNETLLAYVFVSSDAPGEQEFFSFVNYVAGFTRKNILILFDQQDRIKDFTLNGVYCVEAYGLDSYIAYLHPLTEEQLNSTDALTLKEGEASYTSYLTKIRGRDPNSLTPEDLAGNRTSPIAYSNILQRLAEDFAGTLKDISVNESLLDGQQLR